MSNSLVLSGPLSWRQVAAVAEGAQLSLSDAAEQRIRRARSLVESIVVKGIRAYGVNTGVGALCDVIVEPSQLRHLSRNIVMSHAVGVGAPLGRAEVRAIIAAAVNNISHGHCGVRLDVVDRLLGHLRQDWIPEVPAAGSVGYLSHMAHIALAIIGEGYVQRGPQRRPTAEVLKAAQVEPLVLEAKEGLSLVNGTPCVTGLMSLALLRADRLLNWADVIAAMSFENLHGQLAAFDPVGLRLRASPAMLDVSERLQSLLEGSGILAANAGRRVQDALSLRAIPQVHGAAREAFAHTAATVDTELRAVTDNPVVVGTVDEPRAVSQANALGASIGLSADAMAVAMASIAAMAERRLDRLVNPLVSGLPAFLASDSGAGSGFMIAQYTAAALVAENRRLAAPASLDGGVTSGLQEDHLCHATPAALKLLKILDNVEFILSIELLATVQAYDLQPGGTQRAPNTDIVYRAVRGQVAHYRDERPLGRDIERVREMIREPTAVDFEPNADEREAPPARPQRVVPARERAPDREPLREPVREPAGESAGEPASQPSEPAEARQPSFHRESYRAPYREPQHDNTQSTPAAAELPAPAEPAQQESAKAAGAAVEALLEGAASAAVDEVVVPQAAAKKRPRRRSKSKSARPSEPSAT